VHRLSVPVDAGSLGSEYVVDLLARFHDQFEELYGEGVAFKEAGVEIVSFRVQGHGEFDKPRLAQVAVAANGSGGGPSSRRIHLGHDLGEVTADVVRGPSLVSGDVLEGPVVIEHPGTTIFVGPSQTATIDSLDNTVITVAGR
jgi:N-methylhydantoinase A